VTLLGDKVTVAKGLVNAEEPFVKAKRVSESGVSIPVQTKDLDKGPLWVCLRVTVDAESGRMRAGKEMTEKDVSVVVRNSVKPEPDGLTAYHPLAILWKEKGSTRLRQIAYFDYQHATAPPPGGVGKGFRHYFHVA
jgi:hypothetical protein